jgi:hypothetical protein
MVSALTVLPALLALVAGAPASAAGERVVLTSLALRGGAVDLGLTKSVTPVVKRLANPPRVYVDLPNAALGAQASRSLAGAGAVKRVRAGQFDATTVRVVVELAEAVAVDAEPRPNGLRLVVGTAVPVPKAVASAKAAAAPKPTDAKPVETAASALPPDVPRLLVIRAAEPLAEPSPVTPSAPAAKRADRVPPTSFQERIARRAADEDWAGVVALYAADMRAVDADADSATRAAVVDALRELGLVHSARKLLGAAVPNEAPALRIARAELAIADGAYDDAAALVAGLDDSTVDPMLAPKLRRVQVRLALARGDLAGAVAGIGNRASPELRAELADAAIRVGRGASDERSCRRGVVAFKTALDADGGRTANAAAGAGLVRAGLACADADAATHGLGVLAESPHPLLRRAATAIAKTQVDEKRPVPVAGQGG